MPLEQSICEISRFTPRWVMNCLDRRAQKVIGNGLQSSMAWSSTKENTRLLTLSGTVWDTSNRRALALEQPHLDAVCSSWLHNLKRMLRSSETSRGGQQSCYQDWKAYLVGRDWGQLGCLVHRGLEGNVISLCLSLWGGEAEGGTGLCSWYLMEMAQRCQGKIQTGC